MELNTSCKKCIWSEWDSLDKTQHNCKLGKLEKFGDSVIECYDNEETKNEFFVIKGRHCPFLRNSDWKAIVEDQLKLTVEEQLKIETQLNYQVVLLCPPETTKEEYAASLEGIYEQDIKPAHITVSLYPNPNLNQFNTSKLLKNRGVEWRVQTLSENHEFGAVVDLALDSTQKQYVLVMRAPTKLSPIVSLDLQRIIVENISQAVMLFFDTFYVTSVACHKYMGGNFEKPLQDKIKEDGFSDLILDYRTNAN